VTVDFEVKRGVWLEGKLTDKATGKPVQGRVQYFALTDDNPNLPDYPGYEGTFPDSAWNVSEDGTYRVVGIPGPGVVVVQSVNHHENYLRASERDDADGAKAIGLVAAPFNLLAQETFALARIDPAKGTESIKRDVALDPGVTYRGTLVGPDGKPLVGARSSGLTHDRGWEAAALETAEFTVRAFNPKRPRLVLFRQVEKGLVGVFEPPQDASKPVTVRMQPGAVATGRLVDADGLPRPNVELEVSISPGKEPEPRLAYSLPGKIRTDKDGRFRVETLVPGYRYQLYDHRGTAEFGGGLKPGEVKNLGDVQLMSIQ